MNKDIILVVEDEADIRELIGMYMMEHGFEVLFAGDGEQAINVAHQKRPDLVILDVNLPEMDGVAVCKQLRKNMMTPIVFLTCRDEAETMVDGLEAGGDDYITKPFDPNVLVARVRAHLRRAHHYQQQEGYPSDLSADDNARDGLVEPLTQQESNILHLIQLGFTNQEIAARLNLTIGTVKWYNNQIFGKLAVANRMQAVTRAKQLRILCD